ncbi:kinase-like protein, partial [Clavulina sp. PMI_390]
EIVTQIQVQHPNILPILGVSCSEDYPLSIVAPLAANGNALRYLNRLDPPQRPFPFQIRHLASALVYLHGMLPPLIHGDVDPRNILVDDAGNGLLSDFGLSRIKHEPTRTATVIVSGGKYRYLAPELLRVLTASGPGPFRTTAASDCYAFGMTFFELATLQKPFSEYGSEWEVSNAAMHGRQPEYP